MSDKYPAELDHVEIWFTARASVASDKDTRFCISMTPEEAIEFLSKQTPSQLDGTSG
jgi:hypothetical protein